VRLNKDSFASLIVVLLVISSAAYIISLSGTANATYLSAQDGEIILEGADFNSTSALQYLQNLPTMDITRIVIEYADFSFTTDVHQPQNMPSPSLTRIIIEYADVAIQLDVQPPQGQPNPDVSRIVIEYADYANIVDTSVHYLGPQAMGRNDTSPPEIGILHRTPPDEISEYQAVTVTVNITDVDGGVKNATLEYTLNNGTNWISVPMTLSLLDYTNSLSVTYYGTIPGQSNGTWVYFRVIAYDYAWNTATRNGDSPYSPYQVVPEFLPITLILFLAISSLSMVVLKKKQHHQRLHMSQGNAEKAR